MMTACDYLAMSCRTVDPALTWARPRTVGLWPRC